MTQTPDSRPVLVAHRDDGVVTITLAHGKLNPLSIEVLDALRSAVVSAADDGARALVITGNERAFAAGADITQFTTGGESFELAAPERVRQIGRAFLEALNSVAAMACPTIAAINGVALGGGCELALACDFRIVSPDARLGQPEILLGIIPGGGGTQRLARLVGPARAKDLVFSGRTVDAEEALAIGLVDRIGSGGSDLLVEAVDWAGTFARGPRHALALAKRAIDGGLEGALDAGLLLEQELFVDSFATTDARSGVESFLAQGPGKAQFD